MDPSTEAYFLGLWYTLMQTIFSIIPPLYLALSLKLFRAPAAWGYRIILPLLTSFASLCLLNEAYYLALPVYVCHYPVIGKYYHHPDELMLYIKCILNLSACIFAGIASVDGFIETLVLGNENDSQKIGERKEGGQQEQDAVGRGRTSKMTQKKTYGLRWKSLRVRGRLGRVLMLGCWTLGMCGYFFVRGVSKKRAFGF